VQLADFSGIFIFFGLMVLAGIGFIVLSHAAQIRVKGEQSHWANPYECGVMTDGHKVDRYPIHYYLVGIMFVIFDVETIFFVPWALSGHDFINANAGSYWFWAMFPFFFILVLGYIWDLKTGILDWGHEG
jgi:NADH-quinone oxidoreductase subunit A